MRKPNGSMLLKVNRYLLPFLLACSIAVILWQARFWSNRRVDSAHTKPTTTQHLREPQLDSSDTTETDQVQDSSPDATVLKGPGGEPFVGNQDASTEGYIAPALDMRGEGIGWGEAAYGSDSTDYSASFPSSPVSLKALRMCDTKYFVPMKSGYVCTQDPTCVECMQPNIRRNTAVRKEFETEVATSSAFIDTMAKVPKEVVLMTVNSGQVYLLINWYRSVRENVPDLNPCLFTLVIATDDHAAAQLESETCLTVLTVKLKAVTVSERYHFDKANIGAHSVINNILFLFANHLVQTDHRVLVHDVDQVWLQNPFPMLHKLTTGLDSSCIYAQYHDTARGFCNTGFVYVLPTAKSKVVWASIINAMTIKGSSDQALFNTVLRYRHFREYYVRTLPLHLFNKKGSSKYFDRQKTLVYHAVSTMKKDQFVEKGIWYMKPGEDPQSKALMDKEAN